VNPFIDVWQFLTATTSDYLDLGGWRFLILVLFWALFIASIALAAINFSDDPTQRTPHVVGFAIMRVLIGCMWFQGMLWKLPLPASDGLRYWTEQEVTRAAFAVHGAFIKDVVMPNIVYFGPFVFLAELTFAISLILGFAVRVVSVLAILFVLQLWLGIYRPGDPAEWSWSYMFLGLVMAVHEKREPIGWLLNIAS
jgi:hypothetical protein